MSLSYNPDASGAPFCFLCSFAQTTSEKGKKQWPEFLQTTIDRMSLRYTGDIRPICVAVHGLYEKHIRPQCHPPLPDWPVEVIYEHILVHRAHPRMATQYVLGTTLRMCRLCEQSMATEDPENGAQSLHAGATAQWQKLATVALAAARQLEGGGAGRAIAGAAPRGRV